jgi:hypothetical protein
MSCGAEFLENTEAAVAVEDSNALSYPRDDNVFKHSLLMSW